MSLILVGISIIAIFAMAALAIDMGLVYTARTNAQSSADAAALAGAFTFLNTALPQPQSAQNAAIAAAGANKVMGDQVTITAADVAVDIPNRRVTVTVNRDGANAVATHFAAAIGATSINLRARATAECETSAVNGGTRCLKPLYIPNTALANPALTHTQACAANQKIYDSGSKLLTPYATAYFSSSASVNTPRLLRPTRYNQAVAPGQYYSLDFGSGGQDYRCTIAECINQCGGSEPIRCGNSYPLKTGNMVGPTVQGFNELIGAPAQDQWVAVGQYRNIATGQIKDTSPALVAVPVWDDCVQPITSGTAGQQLQVIGFVQMFVNNVVQSGSNRGDTTAYFVSPIACADASNPWGSGDTGGGGSTGPFGIPIRLVQNPQ